jgi:glycosyltransferase involved in cell wall biosynthesis
MKISLYFINFNDIEYLPFIKKHYGAFCHRIVMYDNYSDDGSRLLAQKLGFEVRLFGQRGQLNDQHYLDVKNHCWKEARGHDDYVIVCDADEFIQLPYGGLKCSAPIVEGFNMISDKMPVSHITEISTGAPSEAYSKQAIFDPNKITEINFVHGCHKNNIQGDITRSGLPVKLLHYRMIGGVNRILERHEVYRKRMSAFNRKHRMGYHYLHSDEQKKIEWNALKNEAQELW